MTVELGTTPYSDWQRLTPLLNILGCALTEHTDTENWYLSNNIPAERSMLLVYTSPQQALVNAMAGGESPAKALKAWEKHAQRLVALYKSNRRRAVLVNLQEASSNLEGTAQAIASHWNKSLALPEAQGEAVAPAVNPYYELIASVAIHQNPHLNTLLAQLEACALPIGRPEKTAQSELDLHSLYQGVREFRRQTDQLNTLTKQYDALNESHLALKEHSATVQKELEQAVRENNKQYSAAEALEAETERLKQALGAAQDKKKADEAENQLIVEQLHLVQEELEKNLLNSQEKQAATSALKAQVQELQAALATSQENQRKEQNKLQSALSTAQAEHNKYKGEVAKLKAELAKITGEAESIRSQAGQAEEQNKKNTAALEDENQLVIEQLHFVQEELERQLLNKQSIEKQLKRITLEQDHALEAANKRINQLQNELNQIKSSVSWKAAAPVRVLGRPFKRTPLDKRKLKKQVGQLGDSQFFNAEWYLETYPDVAEKQMDPAEHYLKFGADEGRNPSEDFETHWYTQANPDVQASGINPLIHFLNHGHAEGRAPNPRVQNSLPSPQEAK